MNYTLLDTALEWARRYPAGPQSVVEVRPTIPNGGAEPGRGTPQRD